MEFCRKALVCVEKVRDCYLTPEGLSHIARVVGKPLCAVDEFTSCLDILPFAKMCVEKQSDNVTHNVTVKEDGSGLGGRY